MPGYSLEEYIDRRKWYQQLPLEKGRKTGCGIFIANCRHSGSVLIFNKDNVFMFYLRN